ncbi:GNAT family N-acetyltransferase [Phaeobacter sp. QD34_3]|uniref:GNAT family N-acetyltransferase n=1 Tax=unclassified Phaeobacter TaxID=2621772 RepID=UPI00237F2B9B|nr:MULTISPECIES: GNAT family N-acetyltransferase [unclassified Phaeobacter]MDE4131853.1 GNAT family N-acetyltransferase [Phaeobacter sp. QD34_3]MDE4135491.1 GNAT family N-acetyltransferase [Phaeobacter sp. QD34_24]MDE4173480.1 GNAT family N-acetyltransferase [Phaeobacter sp. PT47_59]
MRVERLNPEEPRLEAVLDLIRSSFAFMEGRIDPPSSMRDLTPQSLAEQCRKGEIWVIGTPPLACMFLTPKQDCLYLGKLAVAESSRGMGLARSLIDHALRRARDLGLPAVELQTRVELVENHAAFARLGFVQTGSTAHPGFDRPTSLVFRRSA